MLRRRRLLLVVAAFLTASALLAVGILLFGDFGRTEGRILQTTALLGGFGVLALPAAMPADRGRLLPLAAAICVLDVAAAGIALGGIWSGDLPEAFGKLFGTVLVWLAAAVQTAALAARRAERDPPVVAQLFRLSIALASLAAIAVTVVVWAESGGPGFGRLIGTLVVLDLLAVALQPILALARPEQEQMRLHVRLETGAAVDVAVTAADSASAAAKAVRAAEAHGGHVAALEFAPRRR